MKAQEIFKEFGEGYKYLTCDGYTGYVRLFEVLPVYIHYTGVWECVSDDYWIPLSPSIQVTEFENLSGSQCIICVDDLIEEESFTKKDMIDFVEWTNVIYRDLSHTIAIKDVNNVEQLLELFKQTR